MRLNRKFVKTKENGYVDAVEFSFWWEPLLMYPFQVAVALIMVCLMLIPVYGAKVVYYLTISTTEIEKAHYD